MGLRKWAGEELTVVDESLGLFTERTVCSVANLQLLDTYVFHYRQKNSL